MTGQGHGGTSWGDGNIPYLDRIWVIQMYVFIKIVGEAVHNKRHLSKFRERWTHGLSLSFAVTSPQIDKYQTLHNDIPVKMFSDDMY